MSFKGSGFSTEQLSVGDFITRLVNRRNSYKDTDI